MSNPTPILNNINAFDATQGTTISFNIIGGTDIVRSNIVYIYDLSTNDLVCTHLYISTESIHELPPNTDPSIVYASGKSSADFVNNKNYYLQIQTFINTAGTAGGSGMSVAKTFWCLFNPALSVNAIPAAISTTSYNVGATYTTNITDATIPVTNIIQQYKFDLYTATGTLVQTSGNIIGSGEQEGTSTTYNITYNFSGLVVNNSYYVIVTTTSTEGMTVSAQSNTFTVSIDTPTVGGAIVNNNACDGYISVVSNLSDEYGGSASGEMASFETDSVNNVSSLKVDMEPIQEGSGTPSPTNIRPIRGHSGVNVYVSPTQSADDGTKYSQEFDVSLTPTSTDKVPYTFKAVGQDVYGDRESDKIVGGTVGWNQLVPEADFSTHNHWWKGNGCESVTFSNGIATVVTLQDPTPTTIYNRLVDCGGIGYVKDHDYLACYEYKLNTQIPSGIVPRATIQTYMPMFTTQGKDVTSNNWETFARVFKATESSGTSSVLTRFRIDMGASYTDSYEYQLRRPQVFDLTQMFGSTIADYIYSLEQANAGAGVAWFKKLFPKDYYAYNAGQLISVKTSAHQMVGFNAWDEEWEQGIWSNSGVKDTSVTTAICSKNYIHVLPNMTYYVRTPWALIFRKFNANKEFIGTDVVYSSGTMTVDADCNYIVFCTVSADNHTTYNHDICINLHWDGERDGEYEAYVKHSYPLDDSLTLRGIPKLDSSNNLYYDGDTYESDGTVTRKYRIVDLGDLSWLRGSNDIMFATFAGLKYVPADVVVNAICPKYTAITKNAFGAGVDKTFRVDNSASILYFKDSAYSDSSAFKTAMSGVYLVYELATPTTETAEPFTNPQVVDNGGTEAYVTTGIVPVGHDSEYLTRDVFGGTLDLVSGVLTVNRKMVDLGSLNWIKNTNAHKTYFQTVAEVADMKKSTGNLGIQPIICSNYGSESWSHALDNDAYDCAICEGWAGKSYIAIADSTKVNLDATSFKTAMNGVQLVYELATPQTYQLTPQQINTLVGQNNVWSEQGDVEVTYNIPITNLLVKRQDVDDVSGDWLTLYSQPVSQASDMDFTYIDFLNQHGKTYRYALVPLLTQQQGDIDVEIEGGYTVSDDVLSVFDGVFVANSNGSQKLKAATEYGDLETNQDVGVLTTIGNKYPFVVSNSNLNYHSGSISALIVPSDFYTNGDLDRLSIVERREAIEKFLTDKTAKILKDWNGNIWLITFVENVEVSFVDDYGMGLGTLSAKWVEIGDVNDQTDLKQTGLI